jgi:hypothetical protein
MSSFGLLVSNIVSSFIIVNHPLFGIKRGYTGRGRASRTRDPAARCRGGRISPECGQRRAACYPLPKPLFVLPSLLGRGQGHLFEDMGWWGLRRHDLNPGSWSIPGATFLIRSGIRKGVWDEKEGHGGSDRFLLYGQRPAGGGGAGEARWLSRPIII